MLCVHVEIYPIENETHISLKYVVIMARYENHWLFVRHRERSTWEIPGGKIERDETVSEAAIRELYEETGCTTNNLQALADYRVTIGSRTSHGRLFVADIATFGELPESEIIEVIKRTTLPENLTYPMIQPHLFTYGEKCLQANLKGAD